MRLQRFLDRFREAAALACAGSIEPLIEVRLADGREFTPKKIKARSGHIIICESNDS